MDMETPPNDHAQAMTATRPDIEIMRAAARLMRERANAATPGPWWADDSEQSWRLHGVAFRLPPPWTGAPEQVVNKQILKAPKASEQFEPYWPDQADSTHMVPMVNPAVALALADWLDAEADLHGAADRADGKLPEGWTLRVTSSTRREATAVARAYLDGAA